MNDSTQGSSPFVDATIEHSPEADYRLREMEARLDRRLEALEHQRARVRWTGRLVGAGLVLNLVALAWVVRTATPSDGEWAVGTVSAQEIVLRDLDGVARARLATTPDGLTHFALADRDGRDRIRLAILADGSPGVTISDSDARPRAVLGYLPDGTTNLVFADAAGISRAVVGVDPDGSSRALFSDRAGSIRTMVGVGPAGEPSVSTFEASESEDDEGESSGRP